MYANMKRMNNDMAVSPIVATLVLIVVAVIGAVAVGTIMGTFSTSVSKNVNANQANAASQNEILVAGSTTVDPITRAAGTVYTSENPGVKIVSQATGSGAGLQAVGQGVADIGQMSDTPNSNQLAQFPQLQQYQIGMGAIVVITNAAHPANATASLDYADLQSAFIQNSSTSFLGTGASYVTTNAQSGGSMADFVPTANVVLRADSSGTAQTFFTFLGNGPLSSSQVTSEKNTSSYVAVNGNPLVVSTVGATSYSLGFADYGDVVANTQSAGSVMIVPYTDATEAYTYSLPAAPTTSSGVQLDWNALRGQAHNQYKYTVEVPSTISQSTSSYKYSNISLLRNLWYVTNGQPSSDVKNFIEFVQNGPVDPTSSTHEGIFEETNNFAMTDIA
jgi:phosphate transport system substrate-binding protein